VLGRKADTARGAPWHASVMKTKRELRRITQSSLFAAFACALYFAFAAQENPAKAAPSLEETARFKDRNQLPSIRRSLKDKYIRKRLAWLEANDRRHLKAFTYLDTLIDTGYGPRLLDGWLNDLYDGVVIAGMPGQLVLDYYGMPVFRNEIVYHGLPAQVWGIPILPGRVMAVTVTGGEVVRVRG
jgi:hypothetical protein